jgi:hypothetical protein
VTQPTDDEIRALLNTEELASLEHDQWIEWSKTIAHQEILSQDRVERWKSCWVPYADLSEEMKEHDRKWARKVADLARPLAEEVLRLRAANADLRKLIDAIDEFGVFHKPSCRHLVDCVCGREALQERINEVLP